MFPLAVGMGLLFVFSVFGLPIAFGLILASFACIALFLELAVALTGIRVVLLGTVSDSALLPIPLFVFMASIFISTGVSARAYQSFSVLFGGFRAGLLVATNWMLAFFGALMGSSSAAISLVTQMGAPELIARGYRRVDIAGVIAGGSGLAVVIPPSILMVVYSVVMEVPIIPLFAAGLIPGLLMAAGYMMWIIGSDRLDTGRSIEGGGVPPGASVDEDVEVRAMRSPMRERGPRREATRIGNIDERNLLKEVAMLLPLLAVILLMLGSMFLGYASVTEGAAVGVLGAFLVAVGHRSLTPHALAWALWNTVQITGFIMLLIVGGRYFGMYFSLTGISHEFISWIEHLPYSGMTLLLTIMVVFVLLGCVMETISMLVVLVPIAATALVAHGFDPIVLGVLFVINMEMSLTTPPIGGNLFVLAGVGQRYGITFEQIVRGIVPYVVVDAIVIVLVAQFPILATFMADLVY